MKRIPWVQPVLLAAIMAVAFACAVNVANRLDPPSEVFEDELLEDDTDE